MSFGNLGRRLAVLPTPCRHPPYLLLHPRPAGRWRSQLALMPCLGSGFVGLRTANCRKGGNRKLDLAYYSIWPIELTSSLLRVPQLISLVLWAFQANFWPSSTHRSWTGEGRGCPPGAVSTWKPASPTAELKLVEFLALNKGFFSWQSWIVLSSPESWVFSLLTTCIRTDIVGSYLKRPSPHHAVHALH